MIMPVPRANRPLTIAGTTTLPTATPAPARIVPAKSAAAEGAARTSTPTRTGTSASASVRSAPSRRASTGATGASRPKQRIGVLVTRPAASSAGNPLDALEPDVVLRERRRRSRRRSDVAELRELKLHVELIASLEPVEHRRHPPGEVLRAPDAAQHLGRVVREA